MSQHGLGATVAVAVGMSGALLGAVPLVAHPVVVLGAVTAVLLVRKARRHGTGTARRRRPGLETGTEAR